MGEQIFFRRLLRLRRSKRLKNISVLTRRAKICWRLDFKNCLPRVGKKIIWSLGRCRHLSFVSCSKRFSLGSAHEWQVSTSSVSPIKISLMLRINEIFFFNSICCCYGESNGIRYMRDNRLLITLRPYSGRYSIGTSMSAYHLLLTS